MKANELLKKLGNKLLGKKSNTSPGDVVPKEKAQIAFPVFDKLGVIKLHENWRN